MYNATGLFFRNPTTTSTSCDFFQDNLHLQVRSNKRSSHLTTMTKIARSQDCFFFFVTPAASRRHDARCRVFVQGSAANSLDVDRVYKSWQKRSGSKKGKQKRIKRVSTCYVEPCQCPTPLRAIDLGVCKPRGEYPPTVLGGLWITSWPFRYKVAGRGRDDPTTCFESRGPSKTLKMGIGDVFFRHVLAQSSLVVYTGLKAVKHAEHQSSHHTLLKLSQLIEHLC